MIFFITFLRALATCLITNAHYTGIYPTDLIANGGLIGDILFFAISGYCLYNIKTGFAAWYGKRLWRIYLPCEIVTLVYMILGFYSTDEHSLFWWYVYPTCNHFVASIVILYIVFYVVMKWKALKDHLPAVMLGIAALWLLIYFTVYDRSYYHIDTVREPMIRFLFMESMLLGAWFRQKGDQIRNHICKLDLFLLPVCFIAYFASKLMFSRNPQWSQLQFLNQILIFALLFLVFRIAAGFDSRLESMPRNLKKVISFLASMTLEIYIVQNVIIQALRPIGHFPLNWLAVTSAIILAAWLLHILCDAIYTGMDKFITKERAVR